MFTQADGARYRVHPPQTGKRVEVVRFLEGEVQGEHPDAGFGGSDGRGTFVRMILQAYPGHTRGGGAAPPGVPCKSPPPRIGAPPPQPTRAPPPAQAARAVPAA
ncbi:MAG: hypothetical protein GY772_02810, partial [bacterium]|nr:hypothetical protein [bacterium]